MKQVIFISMRIGPANIFLYSYEKEFIASIIFSDKIEQDIPTQQSPSLIKFAS